MRQVKGASPVELSMPVTMTQSKCETPGVPRNVATCESEFSIELGSKLASVSSSVFTAGKRDTARVGNPCSSEIQMKGCYEVHLGNESEENDAEQEGQARDVGDREGLGDISVLLLCATQGICETQAITRFPLAGAVGIGSASGIGVHGSGDEAREPAKNRETSVLRVNTPNIDAVRQDAAQSEGRAHNGGRVAFPLLQMDAGRQDKAAAVEERQVPGEENAASEVSVEPSTEGSALSVEPHAKPLADSHDKTPVKSFAVTFEVRGKHEKTRQADSEGDSVRYDGDGVVTHDAKNTQSGLSHGRRYHGVAGKTEQEVVLVLPLNSQQVQHEEAQGFGKPGKLNNGSYSKPNEERTVEYVDNDGKLLFPHDMSATVKAREYAVDGHVDSYEAFEGSHVEKKTPDMSKEVAAVSGDRHKRTRDEKTRPVKGSDKSRLAQPARVSHGIYEGASSKDGVRGPDGTYLRPNQRALRSSMIQQIVDRAELRLGREQTQMIIDLKPDILGRVHLKISQEAGRVVAEIRAENASTKALIESGLSDLKTALSEKGFSFDAVTVSWSSGRGLGSGQSGGNSLPWFSEPGEWARDGRPAQAGVLTNAVSREEVASLDAAFGVRTYLDYIA